jgi:biopolymer transport protein ExbD
MLRRNKRKRRHTGGDVELNLAAMLDMAFQLLAFFILTFRPAPVEGQLALNMPPPVPQTKVETPQPQTDAGTTTGLEMLPIGVSSDATGNVSQLKVGSVVVAAGLDARALEALDTHLRSLIGVDALFDRIQISADGTLRYGELMKVLDVCRRQRGPDGKLMQDISIIETNASTSP